MKQLLKQFHHQLLYQMLTEPRILSVCNVYELFYIKTIFDEWFCNNQLVHQFVLYLIQVKYD